MKIMFNTLLMASTLTFFVGAQAAAAGVASETRPIDARVTKITLDGVVSMRLKQGDTPSMILYAEKGNLAKIVTTQSGDTLHINSEERNYRHSDKRELRVEIILPTLSSVISNGLGDSDISGFGGETLSVKLAGAGQIAMAGQHKNVNVSLKGLGNMTLVARNADKIELDLPGAGQIVATGQTKSLNAVLSGLGNLNAENLISTKSKLTLSGAGNAAVFASAEVDVDLSGIGTATVHGQPARRKENSSGMGRINWK